MQPGHLEYPGRQGNSLPKTAELIGVFRVSALAASSGLNVTFRSYRDHMDFGFRANAAAIGDVQALADQTLRA